MKSYFWKFVLCLVPCALAAWVSIVAIMKYQEGAPGGFKFGVDLVGGTILVYEIDLRKNQDADNKFDANRDINVLAESLKRRIDPNDLKNIVIRPAGGEGRVEIILPTGGTYRTEKAEKAWNTLLKEMEKKWGVKNLEVGRGRVSELADRIQHELSQSIWEHSLFATPAAWNKLIKNATDYWAELDNDKTRKELESVPVGQLKPFEDAVFKALIAADVQPSDKTIEQWVKKQAWEEMLSRARDKWSFLKTYQAEMSRIPADGIEQLIAFIQVRGSIVGQAGADDHRAADRRGYRQKHRQGRRYPGGRGFHQGQLRPVVLPHPKRHSRGDRKDRPQPGPDRRGSSAHQGPGRQGRQPGVSHLGQQQGRQERRRRRHRRHRRCQRSGDAGRNRAFRPWARPRSTTRHTPSWLTSR